MTSTSTPRPVVLCILDGWGESDSATDNAIGRAHKPVWDRLMASQPHALIDASELHVGLPQGQMGNSEVGHMNIGAGRVVMQDLPRIDKAIADGELRRNPLLRDFIAKLKASGGRCHLLGLLSPGGVHSHQDHMVALAGIVAGEGIEVAIHGLLDGRDTPPSSARGYVADFEKDLAGIKGAALATIGGRYFGMDRDKRWDRLERAYRALVEGKGEVAANAQAAIVAAYGRGETDEFVLPTIIGGYRGMADGDGLLCANFRSDRMRQICLALLDPAFAGFARGKRVAFAAAASMTEYSSDLTKLMAALFPAQTLTQTLGEVVAGAGLTQLRIAETEKYAHVTFFFNGGEERVYPGESRILVPSPKVATYDLQPEMSAPEVTDKLVAAIAENRFDLIVVNYANTDMVGHTGDLNAATKAVEAVDRCLGRLVEALTKVGGAMLITADHGNAETIRDGTSGEPHTAHTLNRVPALLVNGPVEATALADGKLADIAPTILQLMGLPKPAAMTGRSLLRDRTMARDGDRRLGA